MICWLLCCERKTLLNDDNAVWDMATMFAPEPTIVNTQSILM